MKYWLPKIAAMPNTLRYLALKLWVYWTRSLYQFYKLGPLYFPEHKTTSTTCPPPQLVSMSGNSDIFKEFNFHWYDTFGILEPVLVPWSINCLIATDFFLKVWNREGKLPFISTEKIKYNFSTWANVILFRMCWSTYSHLIRIFYFAYFGL